MSLQSNVLCLGGPTVMTIMNLVISSRTLQAQEVNNSWVLSDRQESISVQKQN